MRLETPCEVWRQATIDVNELAFEYELRLDAEERHFAEAMELLLPDATPWQQDCARSLGRLMTSTRRMM